jgi:hypothetical protein
MNLSYYLTSLQNNEGDGSRLFFCPSVTQDNTKSLDLFLRFYIGSVTKIRLAVTAFIPTQIHYSLILKKIV